jgi:hypothetical protein
MRNNSQSDLPVLLGNMGNIMHATESDDEAQDSLLYRSHRGMRRALPNLGLGRRHNNEDENNNLLMHAQDEEIMQQNPRSSFCPCFFACFRRLFRGIAS